METGKPGLASAPVHISSVTAQREKSMAIQAPLTAVYIHTVPSLSAQPYPQPPAAAQEPATLHLAMPPLYSKETLPFLTLHIAGGLHSQPGLSLAASAPAARPKSAGKHVCPHCGRDCMKPSVLEKHLRCHTGERPYPCVTCGVSFKTQSNLYKHKRTQAHARLSSESGLSSLDSMSSSRETCASSLSLDEAGSVERDATLPAAETACPASTVKVYSVKTHATVSEQNALTPVGQETEASAKVTTEGEKQRMESVKPPVSASRHLPLQRQEATLFSKQWKSSVSRGKSQSHESTDSGFSESSDHYPSPGSILPDHSMDSLTESTKEHLEETTSTQRPSGPGQGGQEPKCTAKEQKTLEERISKLISENTAVVEDKKLENVRPRKTVLSKQGSIDLPMPYTYKDSFHFDMKISKTSNVGLQRIRKPDFYSSVPTQRSNTVEHAPLTRSNSLPFSVTLLQPERSSPTSSYQSDYVTLVRRGSSGQINPTSFAMKPVNQHYSTHRPLVRQTAVDGNHATDGLFTNSSAEEACTGGLSCDGDGGDICGDPSNRKFRRKKTQKFAYNKWYMYGGGTFKKLYSAEKDGDDGVGKGRKCPTNPEHNVPQGLPSRSSVTTTGSTINYTSSSSATVCPAGSPPARLSPTSAVDLNLKTSSSLKTPLQRNLSLSVLPLSSIGSLVSHQTDSMSGAEAGRMIDGEKHTASISQLCGAHIPSDRKKQKTDEKMICPSRMETDPNTPAHPLPSVTGSAPQQDTNLSYINLQNNHTQLNASFPTCIINTKTPPVSCSSASSTPSATKASFLPKYQLKLPNAAEPESNSSLHVVDKQSSHSEQTSPLARTSEVKCGDPITSLSMQPFTAPTTLCLAETSRLDANAASTPAVVHRQFAATRVTTTCLRNEQAGLCSTSTQPLKSAGGSAPVQSPRLAAPVVTHFPATPTTTTANNQSSDAAVVTAFSQPYPNPTTPPSHTVTDQLNPVNKSNTPVVPCHIVPFDQPDAQNVFHVHTADLQICLQIISDEQLALIEPQIERHTGSGLSQRCDAEAVVLEVIQNKAQSSVTMQSSNNGGDHQQELDQSESLPTLSLSVQFGKAEPNLHLTEHSTQATVSAESTPPEEQGSSLRPHKYGHVNTVTMTQSSAGDVMSTVASLNGVKSGRSQTSVEEHALFLNRCAKEQLLPDMRVSRGGLITQTNSVQHKLSVTSLSPTTVDQNSTRSEESKLKDQAAPCYAGTIKAIGDKLSGSSFSKCKASRELNTHCSNPVESTLSEALDSSKHANMGCDRVGSSDNSAPSQEVTGSEMQDVINSTYSEKQRAQFISVSSNIQVERSQNIPAVLIRIQSPTAGEDKSGGIKVDEVPGWLDKTESNCTYMCLPDMTKPEQGEDRTVKVESFQNSRLSEQLLQHPSQTHSLNSQSPQAALSKSNNRNSSAGCSQTSLFNSPQSPSEMNNFYFSQQQWESSSSIHSQRTQISHQSDSSPCIKAQAELTGIQSSPQQTQTFPSQDQKRSGITPFQRGHSAAKLTLGSTSSDANISPSTQPSQVSHSVQVSRAAAGPTGETKVANNNMLDNNAVLSFTYTEPGDYQDKAANDYSKYQSFQSECLTSGVRPVQSCQDYTEDTSSSDDEGKLIIEL